MCTPGGQQNGNPGERYPGIFFCAFCLLTFLNECGIMEPVAGVRGDRNLESIGNFNNFLGDNLCKITY